MKPLFTKLSLILFLGVFIMASGCKKDKDVLGCTDADSVNYNAQATTDDGSCFYARDKFIGTFSSTENCPSGIYDWTMTITENTDGIKLINIQNLGDFDQTFPAEVNGNNITFDYENMVGGISIDGSGSLATDGITLTINYHVAAPSFLFDESCEVTGMKQ